MNIVDFVEETEAARLAINDWVEDRTQGRIVDLIGEGVLNELTRLVLVNAIWFKANWAVPFDTGSTRNEPFETLSDGTVTAQTMHQSWRMGYGERPGYASVRLPYAGDAAMLLVVPDAGRFEEVRDAFDAAELGALHAALGTAQVIYADDVGNTVWRVTPAP